MVVWRYFQPSLREKSRIDPVAGRALRRPKNDPRLTLRGRRGKWGAENRQPSPAAKSESFETARRTSPEIGESAKLVIWLGDARDRCGSRLVSARNRTRPRRNRRTRRGPVVEPPVAG